MRYLVTVSLAALLSISASPAAAQDLAGSGSRIATDGVEFVTGLMDFDLSGTGKVAPFALRGSKSLTNRLALEFGATMAWPDQQFGSSHLTLPEALLSYSWRLGRVRPFVSGGGGTMLVQTDFFENRWRPTFVGGGGARIQLSDRVYAIGEMRLRGISRSFSGSTAEWLGGIGVSLR